MVWTAIMTLQQQPPNGIVCRDFYWSFKNAIPTRRDMQQFSSGKKQNCILRVWIKSGSSAGIYNEPLSLLFVL